MTLKTLNVGGGFPSDRGAQTTALEPIFDVIEASWMLNFGGERPALLCEPGRAMIADAFSLCARIKAGWPSFAMSDIANDTTFTHPMDHRAAVRVPNFWPLARPAIHWTNCPAHCVCHVIAPRRIMF